MNHQSQGLEQPVFIIKLAKLYSAFFSLIVCIYPEWRKNDLQGQVIETQQVKQGIWWNCMHFATGKLQ